MQTRTLTVPASPTTAAPKTISVLKYLLLIFVVAFGSAWAAQDARRTFNLPADAAEKTVKLFSEQSGRGLIAATEILKGVRTNEVRGEFTLREALDRMFAGTGLIVAQDPASGAFTVRPEVSSPNAPTGGLATARPVDSAAGGTGSIRGQVSNVATGQYLGNVRVRVVETARDYITERDGSFLIDALPPGRYTLAIEYPGLESKSETLDVQGGRTSTLSVALASDLYVLSEFVVSGQREGNAAAIAEQRFAPNITNIITADAFGDITKANVGNLLRRIPGITGITDDEIDTSAIQVRGMDAALTSVDIDGTRAASAMNGSRRQNVNAIPVDIIEKVEVAKAPTAEDDADSLGGRVKLTTKSAFDLKERLLNLRAGASYNATYGRTVTPDRKNYIPPSFGLTYSEVVGFLGRPQALGIFATANYDKFLDARSLTQFGHVTPTGGSPGATATKDYSTFDFTSDELHEQKRMGASVRFEYNLAEHTRLGVSAMFSRYVDDFDRARNGFNGASIDLALSDPDPMFTVVNNAAYMGQKNLRESETDTYNFRAFGTTRLAGFKFNYDVNRQQADKFEFRNQTQFISARRFSYALDWRPNPAYPMPVVRSGADPWTDRFTDVTSTALEVRRQSVTKDVWGGRLDAEKAFEWRQPMTLKAGFRYREEIQADDQERFVASLNLNALGRNLSNLLDDEWKNGGGVGTYPVGAVPSNRKVLGNVRYVGAADPRNAWDFDPAVIAMNASSTVQNSLLNDRRVREQLSAAYLQGRTKLGPLGATAGVRFERTDVTGRYGVRNRAASDPFLQFNGRQRASASYDDYFPSVHLRYNVSDSFVVRSSFSTTIGRPDLDVVAGSADYNLASRSVSLPNPSLLPQRSKNYDLSLEYYFRPVGVVSVGVFEKRIRDYIANVNTTISETAAADLGVPLTNPSPSVLTWTLGTQENSGDARVRGLEFNYTQQFSFLPGAFRGLGAFVNYTWLDSEGTRQIAGGTPMVTPLINFIPRSGNAGLSYTYGRWDARLQVNYHSLFNDGFNATNPRLRNSFRGAKEQWDFNGRCRVTRQLSVFANLSNFTKQGEPDYVGWEAPDRRNQTITYSFIITGGVNLSF